MRLKCLVIMFVITLKWKLTYGQADTLFFRKDYTYIRELNNFYKINTLLKTWSEAKLQCALEGAMLFYPEDEDEADALMTFWNTTQPQNSQIYIGVAAWNVKDVYETVDGRQVSDVYDKWAYNEPNNAEGDEGCVVMRRDGTLRDESCENRYAFICKKTLATLDWNSECNIPDTRYKYNKALQRCYKFHLTPKNWTDAYAVCSAEQSYLAILNSPLENQYLINVTAEAPKDSIGGDYLRGAVHLGFYKKNGIWETINGVPLHESGFGAWGYTQPDGGGTEDCGSMFYTGELNDIGCWHRMFFICEHEVDIRSQDLLYKYGRDHPNAIPYN